MKSLRDGLGVAGRGIWIILLMSFVGAGVASAQSFKKVVDRQFPVFFYCPFDPALVLTFTAAGPEAILKLTASNFNGASYNANAFDNIAVVPQAVFQANQVLASNFDICYTLPGTEHAPGYNFTAAATPEAFLDLFDTDASRWTLGPFGYFSNNTAPRNPVDGSDVNGGALGLGQPDDGSVSVSASTMVKGLVPGQAYVVTGWWYTQNRNPLEISVDFNVPVTLNVSGVSFAPQTTGADFASNSIGSLNGAGTFTAPLQLRSGSILKSLSIVAEISDAASSVTGRILRVDSTIFGAGNPTAIAAVNITGSTGFLSQTATVAIPDVPIDLTRYHYYLAIQQDFSVNTLGMRLVYQPPDPAASSTIGVAGLAFDAERGGIDFRTPQNGTLTSTGATSPGKFIAPVRLPHAATVTSMVLTANDNAATEMTARLVRVPAGATSGTTMAQVTTFGNIVGVRNFTTSVITDAVIDNSAAFYYLELDESPSGHNVYGVRVVYSGPPASPVFPADALAAAPFVAEESGTDQRAPVNNALAGQYRFDMGLDLRDGRQMSGFSMSAYDNSPDLGMTAFLYKVDTTVSSFVGPQLIARLESAGQVDGERIVSTDALPGHVVDLQHYFYYVQLYTGLDPVRANGVTVTYLPCGDNDGDGFDGCVNDCIDTRASVRPGAPEVCDGVVNDCNSPTWPDPSGTIEGDDDFDGFSECQGDCADSDFTRWSPPGEVPNLQVGFAAGTGIATVTWSAPANPGGTAAPVYDTLRSFNPSNFLPGTGICAETNGADLTSSFNATTPTVSVGQCLFLLVRAEGACGMGPLGSGSNGVPLIGRSCP